MNLTQGRQTVFKRNTTSDIYNVNSIALRMAKNSIVLAVLSAIGLMQQGRHYRNIGTDRSEQTVQTQIRLLLMEQSDQGLLCLLFCLHLLNTILHCKIQPFQL